MRRFSTVLVYVCLISCGYIFATESGDSIGEPFWGIQARSNGADTGSGDGPLPYQCVYLAQEFAKHFHDMKDGFGSIECGANAWTLLPNQKGYIAYVNDNTSVRPEVGDLMIWWTNGWQNCQPTPGIFTSGHIAIVAEVGPNTILVFEQNIQRDTPYRTINYYFNSPDGSWHVDHGPHMSDSYYVKGWLRYPTIGFFSKDASGWHTDGTSKAFRLAWNKFSADGFNKLGLPHDNGGGVYVHDWYGSWVQDFYQSNSAKPRFGAGYTMLVYNPAKRTTFLVRDGFRGQYANNNGPLTYGAPLMNEKSNTNTQGNIPNIPIGAQYSRQDFSLGKSMLWSEATSVFVVNTNILPENSDFSAAGVEGGDPLTLTGWPLSKTQTYLSWTGGFSLQSNDYYRLMQDGVEANQTTLSEATFANLISGATYRYRIELLNGVYGILDVSNEIDITLPASDGFYIVLELDGDNSVFLRVVNDRFPSATAMGIYRNTIEIARIAGTAFSDNSLEYNTFYTYRIVALTASNIILGWSDEISITTKIPQSPPPPIVVPPPSDPQIPCILTEGIGVLEAGPFSTGGYVTAYYTVQINGTAPLSIDRFEVDGEFIDQWGNSYLRYCPAIEFAGGRVFLPGETFRYQMKNTDHFPDLPTTAHLKAYIKLHDFAGLKRITQASPNASAELVFSVQSIPVQPILPNLTAHIQSANTNPTTDDTITLQIIVENNGEVLCPPSALALEIDGVEKKIFSIPELASYARHSFAANIGTLSSGSHTVAALADKNNDVFESDENDNSASITLNVSPALRTNVTLRITNIAQTVFVGDTIEIAFEITNGGNIASGACQLLCGASSQSALNQSAITFSPDKIIIPALSPNESILAVAVFSTQSPDTYTIWASVDSGNEILESNETDNFTSVNFDVVQPPYADLWVRSFAMYPLEPRVNSFFDGNVFVKNIGDIASTPCSFRVILTPNTPLETGEALVSPYPLEIPALSPGEEAFIDIEMYFEVQGDFQLTFIADPNNQLPEKDELNNTASLNFRILPQGDLWDGTDDIVTGATQLNNPTTSEQTHGPHSLSNTDRYDWFKVYLTTGRNYNFNTVGGTGDDYGELYSNASGATRVAFNDDSGGNMQFSFTCAPASTGWHYLRVRAYSIGNNCSYSLKYRGSGAVAPPVTYDAWDPLDNTIGGAITINNPTATEQSHGVHILSGTDNYDWFRVYLTGGRSYNFNTIGGTGDNYGELYKGGIMVASNDDSGGAYQFSLTYKPTSSGWCYVRVRAYAAGTSCRYSLKYRDLGL